MKSDEDCGISRDPLLTESLPECRFCVCCDKEKCDFKDAPKESYPDEMDNDIDNLIVNSYDVLNDICLEPYSEEWKDFFEGNNNIDGIQEIFVKNTENWSRPIGPRKRYQRFRDKRYICDECGRCFTLKQNVQFHITTYHLGNQQIITNRGKRYVCLTCQKVFRNAEAARRHNVRDHQRLPNVQIHRCTTCTRIFQSSTQLKEHISIQHLHERPYLCEKCGSRFGRQGGLRRHFIMVHTNRRYNCKYEGCTHPGFKCSKALTAHIRSRHTKDRPFVCNECGKRFVRRNDQRVHEMLHTTQEQYDCKKCGQRFRRQIYLKKHEAACRVINGNANSSSTISRVNSDDEFNLEIAKLKIQA